MKFHVGRQDLKSAFNRHGEIGDHADATDSHLLLLVYAVECGLKCMLLMSRGVHTTSRLADDDLTHDLDLLLTRLGSRLLIGASIADPNQITLSSARVHEALRYGGHLTPARRLDLLERTKEVIEWIRESL